MANELDRRSASLHASAFARSCNIASQQASAIARSILNPPPAWSTPDFIEHKEEEKVAVDVIVADAELNASCNRITYTTNIRSVFNYEKQIGSGASGRVLKATRIATQQQFAVKEIRRSAANAEAAEALFISEVRLLRKLHHPNIITFDRDDCFMDARCLYIATPFCSGGTLLDKLIRMKSFSERKASHYLKSVLSAVSYMHDLDIVHRDLRCQNVMFGTKGINGVLQIIDFGLSLQIEEDKTYLECVGTPHYMPPEMPRARTGKELKASDVWSVGVIAFILVCGNPPFGGADQTEILTNIVTSRRRKDPEFSRLSVSCKDLINRLLSHDISSRLTAKQALRHEWISGSAASTVDLNEHCGQRTMESLVAAALSEMSLQDQIHQKALDQGLRNLGHKIVDRHTDSMDGNSVVEFLLLHSPLIDELAERRIDSSSSDVLGGFSKNEVNDILHDADPKTLQTSICSDVFGGLSSADVDKLLHDADEKERELDESNNESDFVSAELLIVADDEQLTEHEKTRSISIKDLAVGKISVNRVKSIPTSPASPERAEQYRISFMWKGKEVSTLSLFKNFEE